jgi:hypothetical protein
MAILGPGWARTAMRRLRAQVEFLPAFLQDI